MAVPTVYEIPLPDGVPGRLGIMACPRGGRHLSDQMRAVREAGGDVVVSLLTGFERWWLRVTGEADAAAGAGLAFHAFPIRDHGVPGRAEIRPLLDTLVGEVRRGRYVVVHCRGGIGRSSVVAAAVLVGLGAEPEPAFAAIGRARGRRVPETRGQRRWFD